MVAVVVNQARGAYISVYITESFFAHNIYQAVLYIFLKFMTRICSETELSYELFKRYICLRLV
jgi:hypothetical protein